VPTRPRGGPPHRAGCGRDQCGTATVEFALVLPLLLVMSLALVQVGLLARDRLLVEAVARAGAGCRPDTIRAERLVEGDDSMSELPAPSA
jgi:Flp pilus assembly protein TadG